jgi:hypothetical protein
MVYFSILSSLIEIIRSKNLKPMKDWSFRHRNDQDGRPNRIHYKNIKKNTLYGQIAALILKRKNLFWLFIIRIGLTWNKR